MLDGASHSTTAEGAVSTQPGEGSPRDNLAVSGSTWPGEWRSTWASCPAGTPEPGGLKRLQRWRARVVGTIDLDQDPPRHGLVNSWIPIIAAVVVGFVLVLQDWQAVRDKPEFGRYLFVDAVAAFVLTPLFVSAQLGLRGIATLELCRLIHSKVIRPAENGERPSQFGPKMDRRLDQTWVVILTALATVFYLIFELVDALNEMTSPLTTLLIAIALVVRVALFYLGVLTVIQIWEACRAIGTFLDRFNVNIHPLDPDSCGGLAPIGHMFSGVLIVAAFLGGAGLCIFLAAHDTPSGPTLRPEPYILAFFYFLLLPRATVHLLWGPHQRMKECREELLIPVMREFRDAIRPTSPPAAEDVIPPGTDNARRLKAKADSLKAKADSLSAITSEFKVVYDACPVWPLPVRRLEGVVATAVLPVVIPVVTAIISSFLARAL
jgi:uncharacterized membrane protein (DUF485 family)